MAFVKLTSDRHGDPVLVNPDHVRSVATGPRGATILDTGAQWNIWVKESVQEVIALFEKEGAV